MRLVVLGATGGVGLEIVRQAITHGHQVKSLVRSATRLEPFAGRIEIERGDLLNPSALETAIRGCDAILSGSGPRQPISKSDSNLLRDFAAALTLAMQQAAGRHRLNGLPLPGRHPTSRAPLRTPLLPQCRK
jgi:uncharacterized protein YbjT (DUF2867 family)